MRQSSTSMICILSASNAAAMASSAAQVKSQSWRSCSSGYHQPRRTGFPMRMRQRREVWRWLTEKRCESCVRSAMTWEYLYLRDNRHVFSRNEFSYVTYVTTSSEAGSSRRFDEQVQLSDCDTDLSDGGYEWQHEGSAHEFSA